MNCYNKVLTISKKKKKKKKKGEIIIVFQIVSDIILDHAMYEQLNKPDKINGKTVDELIRSFLEVKKKTNTGMLHVRCWSFILKFSAVLGLHRKIFKNHINGFDDGKKYFYHCENPLMVKANNYHQ